ncbi:ComEA family DNA-binding protein [Flavobacterium croceum]|uniref:ComEA family DNA-binding protein n=1 Tax=Flavobacterium croceum TaxID=370975 RepID=UPI0024A87B7B|nr:helix-hairpin-helix domain-containing protein [Flavobacterium croceum]
MPILPSRIKDYFKTTKQNQKGIIILFILIFIAQIIYYFLDTNISKSISSDEKLWLSHQVELNNQIKQTPAYTYTIYPFNPNFITEYKGYKLGMKKEEIDRLLSFRKQNKFVNSASDFQKVTHISDSLLKTIAPYFKFPDWVKNKANSYKDYPENNYTKFETKKLIRIDINKATAEDLMKVYGIGESISQRILSYKETLGNFVSMQQMEEIWGLSPEVIAKLNQNFYISDIRFVKKVNVNQASIKELSQFPYFKNGVARNIVSYRSMNGDFKNIEDLTNVRQFPIEKIKIIALYLEF